MTRLTFGAVVMALAAVAGVAEAEESAVLSEAAAEELARLPGDAPREDRLWLDVVVLTHADLARTGVARLDLALARMVPGMDIRVREDVPFDPVDIRYRGVVAFIGAAAPALAIDGAIVADGLARLAHIHPVEVERVEILRGVAAVARYGTRGSNGVISVVLRRGRERAPRAEASVEVGLHAPGQLLPTRRFETLEEMTDAFGPAAEVYEPGRAFDLEGELARTSVPYRLRLGASGGAGDAVYSLGVAALDEPGVMLGTGWTRQTGHVSVVQQVRPGLVVQASGHLAVSQVDRGQVGQEAFYSQLARTPSFVDLSLQPPGVYPRNPFSVTGANVLEVASLFVDRTRQQRYAGHVGVTWSAPITSVLEVATSAELDVDGARSEIFIHLPADPGAGRSDVDRESSEERRGATARLASTLGLRPWRGADIRATAGVEWSRKRQTFVADVDEPEPFDMSFRQTGLFTRLVATWLEGRGAADMGVRVDVLDDLESPPPFLVEPSRLLDGERLVAWSGHLSLGHRWRVGVAAVDWVGARAGAAVSGHVDESVLNVEGVAHEGRRDAEIGVEAGAMDGRLDMRLGAYERRVRDVKITGSSFFDDPLRNVGGLRVRGGEVTVRAQPLRRWDARLWVSVDRTVGADDAEGMTLGGLGSTLGTYRYEPGLSLTSLYGCVRPIPDQGTCERGVLGDAEPRFRAGTSHALSVGPVRLWTLWEWQHGADAINVTKAVYDANETTGDFEVAGGARVDALASGSNPYVEDVSFVRMAELAVAVDVPHDWASGIRGVQLAVQGRNLLTWTSYTGHDPAIRNLGGSFDRNFDENPLPAVRSVFALMTVAY